MRLKRTLYLLSTTFLLSGLFHQCKKSKEKKITSEEVTFTKESTLQIHNGDSLLVDHIDIEIADNEYERQTGLMYRTNMEEKQAMLFIFDNEEPRFFYMKNTLIPLDIIYLNKNLEIVSFAKNAKPKDESSLPSNAGAQFVLEVNAGLVDKWGLKEGNRITYEKK
ncbi:DUF192 domain-containing protein [Zhouia spongiae]|uniref:DUF192 domain-containing protein n=1 Tax=Zhouia spongiae TaxID=2202721 RepID=A0ABY3YMM2_9FLAO|nr:DUF192 domain-containing protein [Zhouia spongiae]UNY99074.1 DUF192 domain-containing protein [Zhouia spongiae]